MWVSERFCSRVTKIVTLEPLTPEAESFLHRLNLRANLCTSLNLSVPVHKVSWPVGLHQPWELFHVWCLTMSWMKQLATSKSPGIKLPFWIRETCSDFGPNGLLVVSESPERGLSLWPTYIEISLSSSWCCIQQILQRWLPPATQLQRKGCGYKPFRLGCVTLDQARAIKASCSPPPFPTAPRLAQCLVRAKVTLDYLGANSLF